jgi:hypothetical protein
MKAKFPGSVCPICLKPIDLGAEIENFMGRWIHTACASGEGRTSVPGNWKWRGTRVPQGGKSLSRKGHTRGTRPIA